MGNIGHSTLEIMLDSGSSISLLAQSNVAKMTNIIKKPVPRILLKTASGVPLPTIKYVTASVLIQNMETPVQHNFFVVSDLIAPAILGLDFLQYHNLVLDFSEETIQVYPKGKQQPMELQQLKQMVDDTQSSKPHVGVIAALSTDSSVIPDECAIPDFSVHNTYELPENCGDDFRQLLEEHNTLFGVVPGKTALDCHYIPTKGPPICVPPRRIITYSRSLPSGSCQADRVDANTRGYKRE